ncbi:MAG: imidazole glycerol phosphate synthase subunit HisF [Candidatus Omnitrophica bacterium]|nr:imidazole glycerol phosphate synthase subunit HisF [Candidatus Omnitrophota bacterium]
MSKKRIIARIDVKNEYVIKGIHLEGLRKIGDPNKLAIKYYEEGIDEIIFMDAVASLYDRNNLFHIIEKACKDVFIPITIGGGIRNIRDIEAALKSGADKVAINTQAIRNPTLIREASKMFGSQCIIGSVEAKKRYESWEAYIDNGRQQTDIDVITWIKQLQDLGVGEIFLTSVDKEGTKRGFDTELIKKATNAVSVPVIASGGAGKLEHITELIKNSEPDAVAIASLFHYNICSVSEIKEYISGKDIEVRK